MDDRTRADIERYLAGGMTDAEAAAFLQSLRGDPERLAHLGRVLMQQAHLFDALREEIPVVAVSPSSRRAWWGGIAAAAAIVAVVIAASVLRPPLPPSAPQPVAVRGAAAGTRAGTLPPATADAPKPPPGTRGRSGPGCGRPSWPIPFTGTGSRTCPRRRP
jgi:hypothetical protein